MKNFIILISILFFTSCELFKPVTISEPEPEQEKTIQCDRHCDMVNKINYSCAHCGQKCEL